MKFNWSDAHFITAPAIDGTHARRNDKVPIGKGGVCLAINPQLASNIVSEGVSCSKRAVWAYLQIEKFGKLGILGLYAPNDASERTLLWRELFSMIDLSYQWTILGDFNMIESPQDQRGEERRTIVGEEKQAWKQLMRRMKVEDSFSYQPGHLRFSWDNKKSFRHVPFVQAGPLGDRVLHRLDRIYTPIVISRSKIEN